MNLQNFAIVAALTSFAAFFNQIKGFFMSFIQFFIRTDSIYCNDTQVINEHFFTTGKILRWGNRIIGQRRTYIKNIDTFANIFFSIERIIWVIYKGTLLKIEKDYHAYKITYLYKTIDMEKEISEIYKKLESKSAKDVSTAGFYVLDFHGKDLEPNTPGSNNNGASLQSAAIESSEPPTESSSGFVPSNMCGKGVLYGVTNDDVIFDTREIPTNSQFYWSSEGTKLLKEIEFWLQSRKWFRDKKLPWKRSAMLTGQPGTGKSKLILEIAKKLGLPVYRLNIGNMSSKEFVDNYNSSINTLGSIILIEDIDSVFVGRENILATDCQHKQLLSFDVLINTLGGIKENDGAFTIITTNHPEKLDAALTRPGRFDVKIEVLPLDKEGKYWIANNLLSDWPDLVNQVAENPEQETAAEFENRCVEIAVSKFWEDKNT